MSFQKAHQISNELGEVLIVSDVVNIDTEVDAATGAIFPNQPFVDGVNYRILAAGFTANATTAAGTTITIELVTGLAAGTPGNDLLTAQAIPVLAGPDVANGVGGATVSTTEGGAAAWEFQTTNGLLDAGGVPRLLAGQQLRWITPAHGGTGHGRIWVKLAPEIQYKD
jgi:hypothetical protein